MSKTNNQGGEEVTTNDARCRSCPPGGQCRSCRRRRVGGLAGEDMTTMQTTHDFVTGAATEIAAGVSTYQSTACDSSSAGSSGSSDSGGSCGGDF